MCYDEKISTSTDKKKKSAAVDKKSVPDVEQHPSDELGLKNTFLLSTKDTAQCTDPAPTGLLATPTTILDLADLRLSVSQRIKSQVLDKCKVPLRRHRTAQWD